MFIINLNIIIYYVQEGIINIVLQAAHVFGVAHSQNNKAVKREQLQILITFVNSQLGFYLPLFGCYQKKVIASYYYGEQ